MNKPQIISKQDALVKQESVKLDLGSNTVYSIQVSFSSSKAFGHLMLKASNDDLEYADIPETKRLIQSGIGTLYNMSGAGYHFVKVFWEPTCALDSGERGTITATGLIKS